MRQRFRPPQHFGCFVCSDLGRLLQCCSTEVIPDVRIRTEINQQLYRVCVILDREVVQRRLTDPVPQFKRLGMILHELSRELRVA